MPRGHPTGHEQEVLWEPRNQSLGLALEEGNLAWGKCRALGPGPKAWICHY